MSITSTFRPFQLHYGEEGEAFISNDSDKTTPNIFEEAPNKLQEAGVEGVQLYSYPNQPHVPSGPEAYQIRLRTEEFLQRHILQDGNTSR